MNLKIRTSKTFQDIHDGPRIVVLQGGTRSGKSIASLQYLIVKGLEESGVMISVVRKSFPSLRISALRDFREIMKSLDIWNEDYWKASENSYFFENGSVIEFLSVQDSERRKGTKRDYLFIDETNELDFDDFFQLAIRTTNKIILAYNPSFPPQTHWIVQNVHQHEESKVFISTYKDNPFLDENIVKEIERLRETSPSYWTIYGTGEFGMSEGLVFDNIHTIDVIPSDATLLGYGCDWGYTNDESSMVALFKFENGIILHEIFYMKGLLINEIGNLIKGCFDVHGKAQVIGDSSEPRTIDEIHRMGVNIKPAKKGKDSIINSIDIMKQHKIFVTKSSVNLLNEFYSYQWMKDKANNLLNEIDPRSKDHAIDASRYICQWSLSNEKKNYGSYLISVV